MSNININDRFTTEDSFSGGLQGEIILGRNKTIEEFIDPFGRKNYRSKLGEVLFREKNIIPIGSYDWIFSKMFNIGLDEDTTLRTGDLNEDAPLMKIGSNPGEYLYTDECLGGVNIPAMHFVQGFMIGDGGAKEDNITALSTDYKRRTLFHAIPFRMSNDATYIDPQKYYGKYTDVSNITSYYVKKFDAPAPHKVHSWVTDISDQFETVDETVFTSTSTIPIESYIEIALSINADDARGYFETTGATPRFNELGLIAGWFNPSTNDFDALRLITHFTRPSIILTKGDSIDALYRIYSR